MVIYVFFSMYKPHYHHIILYWQQQPRHQIQLDKRPNEGSMLFWDVTKHWLVAARPL